MSNGHGTSDYPGSGVDAEEFLGYLEGPQEGADPLAVSMGHADPAGGEGGLPLNEGKGGDLTVDQKLLQQLEGIQRQTALAIKALKHRIGGV